MEDDIKYKVVNIDGVEFKLSPDEQIESLDEFEGNKSSPGKKEKED